MRATLNTFWHYLEFVLIFASAYLAITITVGDTFSDDPKQNITEEFIDVLYFSFVTITTLGYGDNSLS